MTSDHEEKSPTTILHWNPRYLHQHILYAIAIGREYHEPDLFITFICNPMWPEITHSLLPNQRPQNRPDRRFHLLLSKLYDKCVTLAEPLLFLNAIDIGTLHFLNAIDIGTLHFPQCDRYWNVVFSLIRWILERCIFFVNIISCWFSCFPMC